MGCRRRPVHERGGCDAKADQFILRPVSPTWRRYHRQSLTHFSPDRRALSHTLNRMIVFFPRRITIYPISQKIFTQSKSHALIAPPGEKRGLRVGATVDEVFRMCDDAAGSLYSLAQAKKNRPRGVILAAFAQLRSCAREPVSAYRSLHQATRNGSPSATGFREDGRG